MFIFLAFLLAFLWPSRDKAPPPPKTQAPLPARPSTSPRPSPSAAPSSTSQRSQVEALYREYGYLLKRRCSRILRDPNLVEDAMQEICLTLCRSIGQYQGESRKILGWLYRIATTHSLQILDKDKRRWKHIADAIDLEETEIPSPDSSDLAANLDLSDFLAALPRQEAEAVVHYYVHEMTQEEIAEVMDVSRDQIRLWLKHFQTRGQIAFRERLS